MKLVLNNEEFDIIWCNEQKETIENGIVYVSKTRTKAAKSLKSIIPAKLGVIEVTRITVKTNRIDELYALCNKMHLYPHIIKRDEWSLISFNQPKGYEILQ